MTDSEQRKAAADFYENWKNRGYEKGETQAFWMELLRAVYGVKNPARFIVFENRVRLGHTAFIDAAIPATRVLIEQKGKDVDLDKPAKQSDGSFLTPYRQAKRYADELELSKKPRWIVVCNFREFRVHDMEHPHDAPEIILLENLPKEYYRLSFLTDNGNAHLKREMELSVKAGELVGQLYDGLLARYRDPAAETTLKSLNMLCVRLVFCLYAEDAGIFASKNQFHDYLSRFEPRDLRRALIDLFQVLNTPAPQRDPYLDDALAAFPYVNGGLFAASDIEIPQLDEKLKNLLLSRASDDFDWSEISPTIFGAVFESTLNPETRRSGGMHYTSIENIHKVIDPLFLDALKDELAQITPILHKSKHQEKRLRAFQEKLAALNFLDPACGSGNFLTETYLSLRRLENDVLRTLTNQIEFNYADFRPIRVSIGQFYGIEINDFAVAVAQTALWIAESQMMRETEDIVQKSLDFLPLKSYANIREGNALRLDWANIVPVEKLSYIMGNPPFVGARLMNKVQKDELVEIFGSKWKNVGNIDYVSGWFYKAAQLIAGTPIRAALVATNSVCQGEQVAALWKPLFSQFNLRFDFAYRTFRWDSDASAKAHVHCVIIGFHGRSGFQPLSCDAESSEKRLKTASPVIFTESGERIPAKNINAYLIDAPDVFIESRKKPICDAPEMIFGSMPNDGGFLSNFSDEEKNKIVSVFPHAAPMFRPLLGAQEFINRKPRWCLWLKNISPKEIKSVPPVFSAVAEVAKLRSESKRDSTKKLADVPMLFGEIRQPESGNYLLVPGVSSEHRAYVPMGFLDAGTIASNANLIIPDASLYHFGILTSSVHMAWMRAICGRLESRYRYSASVVYNNFPWPVPAPEQRAKIEAAAQAILIARELYPDCSLADLYDETTMPPELRRAHRDNDRAVLAAYGFPASASEPALVAALLEKHQV